jgi:hypothetical protein
VSFLDPKNPIFVAVVLFLLTLLGGVTVPKLLVVTPAPTPTTSSTQSPGNDSQNSYKKVQIQVMGSKREPLADVDVTISSGAPVKMDKSNSNGYVEFQIPTQSKRVTVVLAKSGFQSRSDDIDLEGDTNQTKQIYLKPVEAVVSPTSEKKNPK